VRYLLPILLVAAAALAVLVINDGGEAPRRAAPTATPDPVKVEVEARATPVPDVRRSRCPDDVPGCRAVRGSVLYVESVDPDGDGDLHVVVTDRRGITVRGLTAIDVSKELRPRRDPRVGERAAAMGPVQTGSFDQSQIHALIFRTRR